MAIKCLVGKKGGKKWKLCKECFAFFSQSLKNRKGKNLERLDQKYNCFLLLLKHWWEVLLLRSIVLFILLSVYFTFRDEFRPGLSCGLDLVQALFKPDLVLHMN